MHPSPSSIVLLEFHPEHDELTKDKELRDGLSVALCLGNTLWVANDESLSLERLTLSDQESTGRSSYARDHKQFALHDYLALPLPVTCSDTGKLNEADIEGLACDGGYLWIAGSHSLRRGNPKEGDSRKKARKRLASVSADGNRYLLGRIPIVKEGDGYTLAKRSNHTDEPCHAALLRGNEHGNELTELLKQDEHFGPFLAVPGKDNGFDIEGLAVAGKHLLLGLRGPVLRGWAAIIEVALVEDEQPGQLRLAALDEDGRLYRKHFLDLSGLGIRDLHVDGKDLLILAGPTMDLDGPVVVYRWLGGSKPDKQCVVSATELVHVFDLPFGHGVDYPEGMTLFPIEGGARDGLLVVYDAASASRQIGESTLVADVFKLPQREQKNG